MKESILIKMFGGGLLAGVTYLLGGLDQALQILLWMIVIDYATGFMAGAWSKSLSSQIGFKGIAKKVMILVIVVVAVQVDKVLGNVNMIRLTVIFFYISNEALSILENASRIGVPLPNFLKNMLKVMKDQSDQGKVATGKEVI